MIIQLPPIEFLADQARKLIAENPDRRNPVAKGYDYCQYNGKDGSHCIAAQLLIDIGLATSETFDPFDLGSKDHPDGAAILCVLKGSKIAHVSEAIDEERFLMSLQRLADADGRTRPWGSISIGGVESGYRVGLVNSD